jgi:quercetin dioxygenase-like cupin family protein
MTISRAFLPITLFGVGLLVGTTLDASSPAATSNVKTLMQMPLADEFMPGREVLVDLVQIPPNTTLDRHWHPGEEFHYYLEGEVEIKFDGEPSIFGTPGAVGHVPFKKWHMAVAGEKGAKILVFRVHTKGDPFRYVDDDGPTDR